MRWRWWKRRNGKAADAERRQQAKLRELRARAPEVRREIDEFTRAVEQALRGSR